MKTTSNEIYLPGYDVFVEQYVNQFVDVTNVIDDFCEFLYYIKQEPGKSKDKAFVNCVTQIERLDLQKTEKPFDYFSVDPDTKKISVNSNLFALFLRYSDVDLDNVKNLHYDLFTLKNPIIKDGKLYASYDFLKYFTYDKLSQLTQVIPDNFEEFDNLYFNFANFKNYLSFCYLNNTNDVQIRKNITALYQFVLCKSIGAYFPKTFFEKDCCSEDIVLSKNLTYFAKTGLLYDLDMSVEEIKDLDSVTKKRKITKSTKDLTHAKKHKTEKDYQLLLQELYPGETEVRTPSGYIDLLTKELLIEIKTNSGWKGAIGQLICYGEHHPNHLKVLALYDLTKNANLKMIKNTCQNLQIEVWLLKYKNKKLNVEKI